MVDLEYDAAGRPSAGVLPPAVNGTRPRVRVERDNGGRVTAMINPKGGRADLEYDRRNRLTKSYSPSVLDPQTGQLDRAITEREYDPAGNLKKVRDTLGAVTETVYDLAYRPVQVIQPSVEVVEEDGSAVTDTPVVETKYDRNGNPIEITDPSGRVTIKRYDELNRLTSTTNHEGITVSYQYDRAGNMVRMTDGKGQTTEFEYDGLNRKTLQRDAAGRETRWEYNGVNRTAQIDAEGQRIECIRPRSPI